MDDKGPRVNQVSPLAWWGEPPKAWAQRQACRSGADLGGGGQQLESKECGPSCHTCSQGRVQLSWQVEPLCPQSSGLRPPSFT